MPIFPVPPVGPDDGGHIGEVIREIVGNRNYSRKAKFGEGRLPRGDEEPPRRGLGLRAAIRRLFRR
jgi:hypothetical protein